MPSRIQSYRSRVRKISNALMETQKENSVLTTLKKHKITLLEILHHKDIPEKDKQRIVTQLKLEGELE
ncbi:MAG: hypothetical protein WC915_01020 [archaeon]|jgi:hypothetical protein